MWSHLQNVIRSDCFELRERPKLRLLFGIAIAARRTAAAALGGLLLGVLLNAGFLRKRAFKREICAAVDGDICRKYRDESSI